MIEELEEEVVEMRAFAVRSGVVQLKKLEEDNKKIAAELSELKNQNEQLVRDTSELSLANLFWMGIKPKQVIKKPKNCWFRFVVLFKTSFVKLEHWD